MTTKPTAEFINADDGIKTTVTKTPQGWAVRLKDTDAGLYLPDVVIYPPERKADALSYAEKVAAGVNPN